MPGRRAAADAVCICAGRRHLAQRVIPPTGIAQGAALVVLACSGICESREALLALGISMWAIAHTLLGSSVYAHVSGVVPYELRSPACGVIRVSGENTPVTRVELAPKISDSIPVECSERCRRV